MSVHRSARGAAAISADPVEAAAWAENAGAMKRKLARNGSTLGTMGLAASVSSSSGERSAASAPGHLVRVSTAAIAAAGGTVPKLIEGLLDAVRVGNMEVKERAVGALHSLSEQSKENAELIGRDGLGLLVSLCSDDGSWTAQAHAAGAVEKLTFGSREMQLKVGRMKHGIPNLAAILRSGTGSAQEAAAGAIASISEPEENQAKLLKALVVPPLAMLLRAGGTTAQTQAAYALGNLASYPEGQTQLLRCSGVRSLLALLGSGKAQEYAARALARLAHDNLVAQNEICKAGGIALLLSGLSAINTEVQIEVRSRARSHAEWGIHRRRHTERHAHTPIITQRSTTSPPRPCPVHAAMLTAPLHACMHLPARCLRCLQSCGALSELCQSSSTKQRKKTQDAIAKAGGIGPLLQLIESRYQPLVAQSTHSECPIAP